MDSRIQPSSNLETSASKSVASRRLFLRRAWTTHVRVVVISTILFSVGYLIFGGLNPNSKYTFYRGPEPDVGSEAEVIIGWVAVIAQIVAAMCLVAPITVWKVYAGNYALTDRFSRSVCYRTKVFFGIGVVLMFVLLILFSVHVTDNYRQYPDDENPNRIQAIGEIELSLVASYGLLYLQATVVFLITSDTRVCVHMIESLIEGVNHQTLTFKEYQSVREEVRYTSRFCQWLVAVVVVVATLDLIVVTITGYLGTPTIEFGEYFFAYVKESVMLIFIIPEIIKINDLADHLTVLLATRQWGKKSVVDSTVSDGVEGLGTVASDEAERVRFAILTANLVQPISFDILFTHFSTKALVSTVIGLVVSLIAGAIKTIASNAASAK
jgi:hypothetical protein